MDVIQHGQSYMASVRDSVTHGCNEINMANFSLLSAQTSVVRPLPMTTILGPSLILLVVLEFTNLYCLPTKLLWLCQM